MEEHNIKLENLSVYEIRKRLFNKQSEALYGKGKSLYKFSDNTPKQVEQLKGFTTWETFSKSWDIYWVGLDPRQLKWIAGRHNSPVRKVILPLRIVPIDERNGRMLETWQDKALLKDTEVPFKKPIPETDEDRAISNSLSGKVVIDETDENKAIRLIQSNMVTLQAQLDLLLKK